MPTELPSIGFTDQTLTLEEYKSRWEPWGDTPVIQDFNSGISDHWSGTITTGILSTTNRRAFEAWARSVGVYGQIYVYPLDDPTPSTYQAGSIYAGSTTVYAGSETDYAGDGFFPSNGKVNTGGQTGNTLATTWLELSSTVLQAGDYFQLGNQLHQLTADATTNGAGNVTLSFVPAMRSSPANGDAVLVYYPKMIAQLMTQIEIHTDRRGLGLPVTFAFEEVI